MPKLPAPKKAAATEKPDIERGDEIYFRHPSGTEVGRVLSRGEHGVTVHHKGERRPVRWEDFQGHKRRVQPSARVVDQGEDGFVLEGAGARRFVRDPKGTEPHGEPMRKSWTPIVLIFDAGGELAKALKERPGLSLQDVTDKRGQHTKRWKRTAPKVKTPERPVAAEEPPEPRGHAGDHVDFQIGELKGSGKVVGTPGANGAHVQDGSGHLHKVRWDQVTGHKPKGDGGAGKAKPGNDEPVPPEKFSAAEFAKGHDKADVNVDEVLSQFPPDTSQKLQDVQEEISSLSQTVDDFRISGEGVGAVYKPERAAVHRRVFLESWTDSEGETHPGILAPEVLEAARPAEGEQPTFTILGGRGGSGKSKLKGLVYDPKRTLVLDADSIKERLPEYKGFNAAQVHEESSDLLEQAIAYARANGLNVVLDATMKTAKGALAKVAAFKDAGYRIEAHYMHLPRQEAAKRAVQRFLGKTRRYVPVGVVLGNTSNEATFDEVRKHADAWSFRDNNVAQGEEPILISESGGQTSEKA